MGFIFTSTRCARPGFLSFVRLFGWLLFLGLAGPCLAGTDLENWRSAIHQTRELAENDVPLAYKEAQRLQAGMPEQAVPADRVSVLNLLSRIEAYLALTDDAERHAEQALALARQHDDRRGQAEADLNIAMNAPNKADIKGMEAAPARALKVLIGINAPDLLGEALLRQSMIFRRKGNLDESVSVAVQTMEIASRTKSPLAMTYAHQGMAISYAQSNRPEEALKHYSEMRDWAQKGRSRMLEGEALLGMATQEALTGNAAQSESALQEAIRVFRLSGASFAMARALFTFGEHLRIFNRPAEALPRLSEASAIYEQRNGRLGLWWILLNRSKTYHDLKRLPEALSDAQRILALAREMGLDSFVAQSAQQLSVIHAAQGKHKLAYQYATEAARINAQLANERITSGMTAQVERYQKESRQREIDLLNQRNEQHTAKEYRLWTVVAASLLLFAATVFFLLRLRQANRQLSVLNAQLEQSRNQLLATYDALPDLLFELDLDGRYHDCHSPNPELLAAPVSDLIGKKIADVLPPDVVEICMAALHEANEQGISTGRQYALPLPQGALWFEMSIARKTTPAGELPHFIGITRDISEHKRIEASLAARELEFRTLAENMPDFIARYDSQGRSTYLNKAIIEMLGDTEAAQLGKTPFEGLPANTLALAEYDEILRRTLSSGRPEGMIGIIPFGPRAGEIHDLRIVAERTGDGNIVGALMISRDITALKKNERQLEESRDFLRELAARNNTAREEERKRIAREIHDELGQVLSAQRLDIATLKLQFAGENPKLGERCRHLLEITDRTIQIVRNVATALRPAVIDMGIFSALAWQTDGFRQRTGIDCQLRVDDIDLDEEQSVAIFRIVQESLTNITRYADAGHVFIALESCGGGCCHLSIHDDGKGFDTEAVRSRSFGLIGIHERALMLGGEAHIISAPHRGTAIEVKIPCHNE